MIDAAQHAALAVYALPPAAASLNVHSIIARALAEDDIERVRGLLERHLGRAVKVAA